MANTFAQLSIQLVFVVSKWILRTPKLALRNLRLEIQATMCSKMNLFEQSEFFIFSIVVKNFSIFLTALIFCFFCIKTKENILLNYEYFKFLNAFGVEYDERYLFEWVDLD